MRAHLNRKSAARITPSRRHRPKRVSELSFTWFLVKIYAHRLRRYAIDQHPKTEARKYICSDYIPSESDRPNRSLSPVCDQLNKRIARTTQRAPAFYYRRSNQSGNPQKHPTDWQTEPCDRTTWEHFLGGRRMLIEPLCTGWMLYLGSPPHHTAVD